MVDSRLRIPLPRLYECFVKVTAPDDKTGAGPIIQQHYPEEIQEKDELFAQIPTFCFPCRTDSPGVQYFTFVLTDIDGKFRFGFCRYPAHAPSCICIISYAPWFEMFYAILNNISEAEIKGNHDLVFSLLDALQTCPIPDVGASFTVTAKCNNTNFKFDVPDTTKLPTIPENRNLTDYFAVVTPEIMVQLFVSMLFERRILVTSKKLSLVTAVVHGSVSLLYPMQWQHIYVPVLPPKLLDYCCAPMPFLLGVHSSMMDAVRRMPLDDVVILDIDKNEFNTPFDDMDIFPHEVSSRLLNKLKKLDRALDDYIASQFLRGLVKVIGGYHDALRFKEQENEEGGKIIFDEEAFLISRSSSIRPFLEHILHLQSFMQFIAGRLDLLNAGIEVTDIFEQEILNESGDTSKWKFQHQQWVNKMKKGGGALKKSVGVQYAYLKGKANDMELKSKVKAFYKGAKSGVKAGYKGAKHQFKEVKQQLKTKETTDQMSPGTVKRTESFPAAQLGVPKKISASPFRHSMYSTLPSHRIKHGTRSLKNPKHSLHAKTESGLSRSTSSDCIPTRDSVESVDESEELQLRLHRADSQSESNVAVLIDLDDAASIDSNSIQEPEPAGKSNSSFAEDQYLVIDNEDIMLEMKGIVAEEEGGEAAKKGWVTFDDSLADKNEGERLPSPIVEIGYDDLLKHTIDESYLIVSPEHDSFKVTTSDSVFPEQNIESQPSLLTDALSCMSLETRSLFTIPVQETNAPHQEPVDPCKDPANPTNPFHAEIQYQEKKKRRPPPRPPPPSVNQGSVRKPPNAALPPRNTPSSKPPLPKSRPTLTSTAFNELKVKPGNKNQTDSIQLNASNDPFAELLKETRNGITQNMNKN